MRNDLVTVVVTWNPDQASFDRSIESYASKSRVIIVDNGSKHSIIEYLQGKVGGSVELLTLKANMGIAFALNKGVEAAKKYNPQKIIFLDQDSIVENNCFDNLFHAAERIDKMGIDCAVLGPIPISLDDGKPIGMYADSVLDGPEVEMKSLYTSGMLVPFSLAIAEPQNERFFIDYVDTEWCYRINSLHAARVFLVPSAKILHKVGDSNIDIGFFRSRPLIVHAPIRAYYQLRNSIWMLRMSHIPLEDRFSIFCRCFLRVLFLAMFANAKVARFKYLMKSVWHGFFNKS